MNFWLWASITDGETYLEAHDAFMACIQTLRDDPKKAFSDRIKFQNRQTLAKYHFITSVGTLMRVLKLAQHLFPEIQPSYSAATHLHAEAKDLRDMIEHAEEYLMTGGLGKFQSRFVRSNTPPSSGLPGDIGGTADATATIVDNRGHWLGGRLNVEWALNEIRKIEAAASNIPAPMDDQDV